MQRKELKELCRAGVPDQHRRQVWRTFIHDKVADLMLEKGPHYFRSLCSMLPDSPVSCVCTAGCVHGWVCARLGVCTAGCVLGVCTAGCVHGWVCAGCVHGWVCARLGVCTAGCVHGWVCAGCVHGWVGARDVCVCTAGWVLVLGGCS